MKTKGRIIGSLVIGGLVIAATVGAGLISGMVELDNAFVIDRFDHHVIIDEDGHTRAVEDLDVTFSAERRGIFRDFSTDTPFISFGGFSNVVVDRGTPDDLWHHTTMGTVNGTRVRIGEVNEFLDPGTYRYRIHYDAPTWYYRLVEDLDRVEIRIDTPGFEWPTSITSSSLLLETPGPILDAQCVEGPRRTTESCATAPVIDGNRASFEFRPFNAGEAATIAVWMDVDAFTSEAAASTPIFHPDPLDESGGIGPWPLTRTQAALVLLVVLAVPLLLWEKLLSWTFYRDRVTDPALHDRVHPTALPEPPHGLRPPEVAGLLLRSAPQDLFLSTLVDLDQRGAISTESTTVPGGFLKSAKETLTVSPAADAATLAPQDAVVVQALFPGGQPLTFTGTYNSSVASVVNSVKRTLSERTSDVFATYGYRHDAGGILAAGWFRGLMMFGLMLFAALAAFVISLATPLHVIAAGVVALVTLFGWAMTRLLWRHHRLPLNSEGRDATAQARAFEEFIRTVEQEQLEWAAGKPGIDHLHPAISLLPYAIALGLADSWYKRFDSVMRELAAAAGGGAAVGTTAWWMSHQSFNSVNSTQSATTTAPSSSGGGGGGGGSGGGGGGGGSW